MKTKLVLASLLCASALYADRDSLIVAPNALPAPAQSFLSQHFKGANIALVKKDMDSYDVTLNDGTEVDFTLNGDWKDVDGQYKPIPTTFLPNGLAAKVQAAHNGAQIIDVERQISGFKLKLNNRMKVYTDTAGNILGQKFDD